MGEAPKDQSQVRRVGRPRKVVAVDAVPQAVMVEDFRDNAEATAEAIAKAQAYALRIWKGQSPDTLSREERLAMVRAGVEAQGMSMDGVIL